jgi:heterodisulfide reductase subunit A
MIEKKGSIGNFDIQVKVDDEVLSVACGRFRCQTGFDSYQPQQGEYGFGEQVNVITLPEFKKLIDNSTDKLNIQWKKR